LDTLAWACAWNGLLAEARAASAEAYEVSGQTADYAGYRDGVEALCARLAAGAEDPTEIEEIAALEGQIASLEAEAGTQRAWEFEDSVDRFLFDTLVRFEGKMGAFTDAQAGTLTNARWRLDWSQRVDSLTLGHPNARVTWAAARAAIAKADGVVASALYAEVPIDLKPQQGLVPIGMNPVTKLWEFYHLRSAWDPRSGQDPAELEIPEHDPKTGLIAVGEATGIVFVLVPGGTFTMGAQARDRDGPNFDPQAQSDETPHEVTLSPYLLARHELTQAQWQRLSSDGVNPSYYGPGFRAGGMDAAVDGAHPVEHGGLADVRRPARFARSAAADGGAVGVRCACGDLDGVVDWGRRRESRGCGERAGPTHPLDRRLDRGTGRLGRRLLDPRSGRSPAAEWLRPARCARERVGVVPGRVRRLLDRGAGRGWLAVGFW
jgi:formylglycine-generating enzyme required for sulfatase activity